jgi:hypothetical protein
VTDSQEAPGTISSGNHVSNSTSATTALLQTQPENPRSAYSGFDLWLHRLTVLLFVFVCAVVGVLLVILPWRPEWTDNRILLAYPALRAFITRGFVRGLCSGLGVLDIWIGFWEAIRYHEGG